MASTRKPFLGSWLMRTTALSAAVVVTSLPLIVAERLGSPETQAVALAHEATGQLEAGLELAAQPAIDLSVADLHAISVAEFTSAVKALVDEWLDDGRDPSMIATDIGRRLGGNYSSGLHRYTPAEIETLLANTAIIMSQLMDETLPAMQSWRDLVQSGFDEIVSPQPPMEQPTRRIAQAYESFLASVSDPGHQIY